MTPAAGPRRWMRIPLTVYFITTSLYCLLYFMPFTYVQLLESELVPALVVFERVHAWLLLPLVALADRGLQPALAGNARSRLRLGFRIVMGATGAGLLIAPLLPQLENDLSAFVWSQVALVPLFWMATIDITGGGDRLVWSASADAGEERVLRAAGGAALLGWLVSAGVAVGRPGLLGELTWGELGVGSTWSLFAHLLVFLGVATGLLLVRGLAALAAVPARVEALVATLGLGVVLAVGLRRLVFAALAFNGPFADIAAGTMALALVASVLSPAARARASRAEPIEDGFEFVLEALTPVRPSSRRLGWIWLASAVACSWLLMTRVAPIDWNFLLQRVCIIGFWLAGFAACHTMTRPRSHTLNGLVVSAVVPLCAVGALRGMGPLDHGGLNDAGVGRAAESVVARYGGYDVSAGLLAGWLQPRPRHTESDTELFRYLQAYTGIPRSVALSPREVRFLTGTSAEALVRPHIFMITVDSLRRDYLGAYNPEVTFTPGIDEFANDSLVFTRAFSHYGATGLSEPSIWVGGLLPHKQYVSPFAPMNSLQTLLRNQGYRGFISVDPILDKILETDGWVTELDQGSQAGEIDLCGSLAELQELLSDRPDPGLPVFAYTQPQDIHIATITRGDVEAIDDASYGEFYAPYASRLRQADTCFGRFIDYLKQSGMYDESVIILTSDHGDSLGEGGRYGHAYTIFPEIIRVPLIMRVPAALARGWAVHTDGLAFTTDLSPTLHRVLGFEPADLGPLFGRSLLMRQATERRDYAAFDHLVVSSYGPVYGLLSAGGRSLYILDSVNYRDYLYDLTTDSNSALRPLDDEMRRFSRDRLRALVEQLNAWYGVGTLH